VKNKNVMTKGWLIKLGLIAVLVCILFSGAEGQNAVFWKQIDEGLHYGDFTAFMKASTGDSKILIIKIDPKLYSFRLLSASELASSSLSLNVKEWADKYKLIAAINAGMFQTDLKSNVGYMKNYSHVNNPRFHKTYASAFAFNPKRADLPPAMVFDTDVKNIKDIVAEYHTVIQNLRLVKRPRLERWAQQEKRWSEAALGQDQEGNILLIFSESPYTMHELIKILLSLPIKLDCAMHLEGGPAASFYLRHNNIELARLGRLELASIVVGDTNNEFLPIPNVIGITKKK
jgi:exopolysaccharide biosynthesis protein